MSMYNLLEYSDNYSMTSGSLWNYYRDEINYDENESDNNINNSSDNDNNNINNNDKHIKCKTKIIGSASDNENKLNTGVVVSLKYLSNFGRSFDLPLIDCEIELDLSWKRYCVISEI